MKNKIAPSEQTQQEAFKIANATQKPGQTKEQTKLIAQGIEKGIALYKKQQKEKSRQADKARKKAQKTKSENTEPQTASTPSAPSQADGAAPASNRSILPWALLIVSWIGFIVYLQTH